MQAGRPDAGAVSKSRLKRKNRDKMCRLLGGWNLRSVCMQWGKASSVW